jgi:hypothetical protein
MFQDFLDKFDGILESQDLSWAPHFPDISRTPKYLKIHGSVLNLTILRSIRTTN